MKTIPIKKLLFIGASLILLTFVIIFIVRFYFGERSKTQPNKTPPYSTETILETSKGKIYAATIIPRATIARYLRKRYYNAGEESTFWESQNNGQEKQISNLKITGIRNAIWSPTTSQVLLRIDNRQSLSSSQPLFHKKELPDYSNAYYLFDFDKNQTLKLSEHIFIPTWSPNGKKIAYIWNNKIFSIADPDGSNFQQIWNLADDPSLRNLTFSFLSWNSPDTIIIGLINDPILISDAAPAQFALGAVYSIDFKTNQKYKIIDFVNSPISSPDGKQIIALKWNNQGDQSLILWNNDTQMEKQIPFKFDLTNFIADSLIKWSSDNRTIYAIKLPLSDSKTSYIFKIDSITGDYQKFALKDSTFRINQIILNEENNYLYLVGDNKIKIFDLVKKEENGDLVAEIIIATDDNSISFPKDLTDNEGGGISINTFPTNLYVPLKNFGFNFRGQDANCLSDKVNSGLTPVLDKLQPCKNQLYVTCAYSSGTGYSAGSNHYSGMAIDIVPNTGGSSISGPEWNNLRNCLKNNSIPYLEEGAGTGNHHFHISHTGF